MSWPVSVKKKGEWALEVKVEEIRKERMGGCLCDSVAIDGHDGSGIRVCVSYAMRADPPQSESENREC